MYCKFCKKEKKLIFRSEGNQSFIALSCNHYVPCTECRDYHVEKILRCQECCESLIHQFPEGCLKPNCIRREKTVKQTATCSIGNHHLRKDAKCCRESCDIKEAKILIKKSVAIMVQNPLIHPTNTKRPCSHYSVCHYCKGAVVKGHRSSTACTTCKTKLVEGSLTPKKKRSRIEFCMETDVNYYHPDSKRFAISPKSVNSPPAISTYETNKGRFGEYCRIPIHALLC